MTVSWRGQTRARGQALRRALGTFEARLRRRGVDVASAAADVDQLLRHTLAQARWAMVAAVLLLAVTQPLIGRVGEPTWLLVLVFALYNGLIAALQYAVPWLRSFAHVAILDLLVVGSLYTMAASPAGPVYLLILLVTVCAAASSPLSHTVIYTAAVLLLLVVIPPVLPLWSPDAAGTRDMFAHIVIVGLASAVTAMLVRRLKQEHRAARRSGDKAAREAELNRLRGVFVSSVSHDLRTPLTALRSGLGMVEMSLHDRLRPNEALLLAAARRNSERLHLLIDNLLTYHQLEAGMLEVARTPCNLADVVGGALSMLQPLLAEKEQRVTVDLRGPLAVAGDPRRLEHAMINVLANAHQHTPARTRIHITGETTPHEVRLTFHDDGPGIPEAEVERVFQRFHRLAPAGTGSGLGLAIARGIVERHGGRMWAESGSEIGTTFYLALPRDALPV